MIGHTIFQLRRARRLSRQELADLSGVSRSVIFQIEVGRTQAPQIRVLEKLAAAMGVGVSRLVNDRGAMLTTLEDPLIRSLTQPVNLVRVLNQQQRSHVLQTLRRIAGPSWARKRFSTRVVEPASL
jgi:transcriptional regulator with XRE-family HTH domain